MLITEAAASIFASSRAFRMRLTSHCSACSAGTCNRSATDLYEKKNQNDIVSNTDFMSTCSCVLQKISKIY